MGRFGKPGLTNHELFFLLQVEISSSLAHASNQSSGPAALGKKTMRPEKVKEFQRASFFLLREVGQKRISSFSKRQLRSYFPFLLRYACASEDERDEKDEASSNIFVYIPPPPPRTKASATHVAFRVMQLFGGVGGQEVGTRKRRRSGRSSAAAAAATHEELQQREYQEQRRVRPIRACLQETTILKCLF